MVGLVWYGNNNNNNNNDNNRFIFQVISNENKRRKLVQALITIIHFVGILNVTILMLLKLELIMVTNFAAITTQIIGMMVIKVFK